MTIRTTFLDTATAVRALLAVPAIEDRWELPSALELMTVGDLTGHLVRAVTTVGRYLDSPAADGPLLDAPGYLMSVDGLDGDITSELHRGIRARAAEEAREGPAAARDTWDRTLADLRTRLGREPTDRRVAVLGGRAMALDDYLVTRLLELVVHADDLAASLDVAPPEFPPAATEAVIDCLLEVARRRHGDLAVVRAFTRRERDVAEALRVL